MDRRASTVAQPRTGWLLILLTCRPTFRTPPRRGPHVVSTQLAFPARPRPPLPPFPPQPKSHHRKTKHKKPVRHIHIPPPVFRPDHIRPKPQHPLAVSRSVIHMRIPPVIAHLLHLRPARNRQKIHRPM